MNKSVPASVPAAPSSSIYDEIYNGLVLPGILLGAVAGVILLQSGQYVRAVFYFVWAVALVAPRLRGELPANVRLGLLLGGGALVAGGELLFFTGPAGAGLLLVLLLLVLATLFWGRTGQFVSAGGSVALVLLAFFVYRAPATPGANADITELIVKVVIVAAGYMMLIQSNQQIAIAQNFALDVSRQKNELLEIRANLTRQTKLLDYERSLLQTLLETTSDRIFFKSLDGAYQRVSHALAREFGQPLSAMLGARDSDFYAPAYVEQIQQSEQRLTEGGQPQVDQIEKESWKGDRPDTWVIVNRRLWRNESGDIIGWLGSAHDITQMKHTQEALQVALNETAALLNAVEAILSAIDARDVCRNLLAHVPELMSVEAHAIFLVEPAQRQIVYRTDTADVRLLALAETYDALEAGAAGSVLRAGQAAALAGPAGPLALAPLQIKGQVIGLLAAVRAAGTPAFSERELELLAALASEAAVAIDNVRLFEAAQKAKVMEEREAAAAAREKLEQQMAGGFAHHMRNELAGAELVLQKVRDPSMPGQTAGALAGLYKLLLENLAGLTAQPWWDGGHTYFLEMKQQQEALEEALQLMAYDIRKALSVTSLILEYSSLGATMARQESLQLAALLREVVEQYQGDLEAQGMQVIWHVAPAREFGGLESHFRLMFDHLVRNAYEALARAPAGPARCLELTLREDPSAQTIMIRDNGEGITPEDRERIFEPFFSTNPGTNVGLGLCFVMKLVSLYNGTIELQSEVGQGTTVTLVLPFKEMPVHDEVTGLSNRRHFLAQASNAFRQAGEQRQPLSLMVLSLDQFREVSGLHGQLVSNQLLRVAAERCRATLRREDLVGYAGGADFAILLPETKSAIVRQVVVERLREGVAGATVDTNIGAVPLTLSLGVVSVDELSPDLTLDKLLIRAEQALAEARARGGNTFVFWEG